MLEQGEQMDSRITPASGQRVRPSFGGRIGEWVLNEKVAWIVLLFTWGLTFLAWRNATAVLLQAQQTQFQNRTSEVSNAVIKRMQGYEQVLRGGAGLFAASDSVSRSTWRDYVASLKINEYYPGIQGIGFSLHIPAEKLDAHQRKIRAEGFPDYSLRPPGPRAEYTSIIYLEPFDERNKRAFGYDMFSEANRHAAMERARDSGNTTISAKVKLVQEDGRKPQAGMLMYLPIYKKGLPNSTEAERKANLLGYVYSPFRLNDLMRGILTKTQAGEDSDIDIELFDGGQLSADSLLYDYDEIPHALINSAQERLSYNKKLELYGHSWSLYFTSHPTFHAGFDESKPLLILLSGGLFGLLSAGLVWMFATQRRRALDLAKRMTEEATSSEARLSGIFNNVMDAIITINGDGIIESCNKATGVIFGYSADELIGHNVKILMPEPYQSEHDGYLHNYLSTGNKKIIGIGRQVVGRRKDGSTFPMELAVSEMWLKEKRIFTGVVRDITERAKIDRMKSEFISTVSHELRTPLTSIRGSLGLIAGGVAGELPAQAKALLDIAQKNGERLITLINDILDMEKIISGKMDFNLRPGPLIPLIEQSLESNQPYADQFDVTYSFELPGHVPYINIDADRFMQVLANLLSNAAKFSPAGGRVRVSVQRQDGKVRVYVADDGQGVPEEFKSKIFQKFSQADSSDTRAKGGTGLGLSISKAMVEKMGGSIGFMSEIGAGTTFYIEFPELASPTNPQ